MSKEKRLKKLEKCLKEAQKKCDKAFKVFSKADGFQKCMATTKLLFEKSRLLKIQKLYEKYSPMLKK